MNRMIHYTRRERPMRGQVSANRGHAPEYAYLDAGTATIVYQALIAGILGALFLLKSFWWRMLGLVRTLLGYPSKPSAAGPQLHGQGRDFVAGGASASRAEAADKEAATPNGSGDGPVS
jgi:hypothetical protein